MNEIASEPTVVADKPSKPRKRRKKRSDKGKRRVSARSNSVETVVGVTLAHGQEPVFRTEMRPKEQPSAPPISPAGPSPAVLELQSDIVVLVRQRSELRARASAAQAKLFQAQAEAQAAQGDLSGLDQEVQYRMGLIAQLENRAPQSPVLNFPQPGALTYTGDLSSFSSEPAPRPVQQGDPNDLVNRGHAAIMRAAI
jgi:hypothetical protein